MYELTKRFLDIVLASVSLLILLPFMLVTAIAVRLETPGPILYRGARVGRFGKTFHILKFRTMFERPESYAGPSSSGDDDPRVTRVGLILRSTKINELPQLLNVLKGDMSFVGPRPQVQWDVDLYTPEEKQILDIPPGITDLASLKYHNEGDILLGSQDPDADYMRLIRPGKLKLQLYYVRHRSLFLDLYLIYKTAELLFASRLCRNHQVRVPIIEEVLGE